MFKKSKSFVLQLGFLDRHTLFFNLIVYKWTVRYCLCTVLFCTFTYMFLILYKKMFIFAYILFGLKDALLNIHVSSYYFHKITILYLFQKQRSRGVLKICSKFTGEHPCRSAISIKLLCNFIEIILRHGCSPVNLLHISRAPFPKNTLG